MAGEPTYAETLEAIGIKVLTLPEIERPDFTTPAEEEEETNGNDDEQ